MQIVLDELHSKRFVDTLRHPQYSKPELPAEGLNQMWSWGITKLRGLSSPPAGLKRYDKPF
jgi:putative transposase